MIRVFPILCSTAKSLEDRANMCEGMITITLSKWLRKLFSYYFFAFLRDGRRRVVVMRYARYGIHYTYTYSAAPSVHTPDSSQTAVFRSLHY